MGDTKWTDDQLKAITTRGCNLLVAAAAGSGKTAVLVERIIRIITNEENPTDIDKLLVVTFTSAAASEMRERVANAISKALEVNPNSKVLQKQLTLLNRSNITTMHSFCLDVIKNNYHVIDLDPTFRISDSTENELLKMEVINEVFEDKYDDKDEEFKNLLEAYSGSKNDDALKSIVLNLYKFSMSGPWPEEWLVKKAEEFNINTIKDLDNSNWMKVLKETLKIEVEGYIKSYEKAIRIIEKTEGLEPYEEGYINELESFRVLYETLDLGIEEITKEFNKISFPRLKTIKKSNLSDEDKQNLVKSIRDSVKKKSKGLISNIFSSTKEESLDVIRKSYPFMKSLSLLVLEFMDKFNEKKRDKNILDFNDLEHLCLKILTEKDENNNTIPSKVAENLRENFDEVLVDEYQDSNNVQETIIELVSRKNLDNPNVFMVGDVKQSIYKFRQAKPELFLEKYNTYPLEEGSKNRKIQLYKNFRSREEVIDGVNYIFKQVMSKEVGDLEYNEDESLNLGASYPDVGEEDNTEVGGPIELHILDKSGAFKGEEEKEEESSEEYNEEEEEDIDDIALEARIVSKRIKELINIDEEKKSFKIFDKDLGEYRNIKFKDIVILLRATKNWGEVFLEELGSQGIPVYADTATGYFETIEIRTMMSLLKVIDNPMQDVPMIAVLKSPILGFNAEELSDIRLLDSKKYFYQIVKDISEDVYDISEELKFKCSEFIMNLNKWRHKALYISIDEFIWYLYMDTAYYGYVGAMPNGKLRQANLRILFQRAKQFEKTSFKGLFNFITFINKLINNQNDLGNAKILGEYEDVVRIMSIHKSKGLEFPVVFTSGFGKNFNLRDTSNSILYHEDLGYGPDYVNLGSRVSISTIAKEAIKKKLISETISEEMRILYVAFTRAKEKLIITGATRNLEKAINKWASAASMDKDIIPAVEVIKERNYLGWVGMAVTKHIDGKDIRKYIGVLDDDVVYDNSKWTVKMWTKESLVVDKSSSTVEEKEEENLFINKEVESIDKEIKRRLDYKYKYKDILKIPSNISVSDLKKSLYNNEDDELRTVSTYGEVESIKPRFMQDKKGISKSERGTIAHLIMQNLNLDRVDNKEEIDEQIDMLKTSSLITEEEEKAISNIRFIDFFKSNIGKRLLSSYKCNKLIKRELPFYTEISTLNIDNKLDEKVYMNEKIRLQGIIDCIFEEEDEIVLIDYKTDYVKLGEEEKVINKYKIQIKYYKEAVEKVTGKRVKEAYLYLFSINEQVKMNLEEL
ncbi:helicase-exonuclease AddAB subunit AddA [Clostridium sp.]|uniref:helicase-exonuclease AddAB subunit AddA n=1 Tax=Clostridium sp. TaxID=1506 RepID=UPI00260E175F|nr:helicase-exonuclease AddAB subunit AddA [Clostridium sp.]